jgi:hypothetical protein
MNTRRRYFTALLFLALAPLGATAQSFSADTAFSTASGKRYQGKVFREGNMVRSEMFANGNSVTQIVDLDKQVSYLVVDRQKMVMVSRGPLAIGAVGFVRRAGEDSCSYPGVSPEKHFSCKQVGEEAVNGRQTLKLEITEAQNGHAATEYSWFDPKLHTVIKVERGASTILELRNIQEGPQPASLFAIPNGYRQIETGGQQGFGPQQ